MTITTDDPFTPGELAGLRSACQGAVRVPGEDRYQEEVATWNLAVRLRPDLVVGARTADDVVTAVRWAARLGLAVGVNATGHGAVPNADGALLINTCRLSRITVDPGHATAIVGAGARMGDVTAAAARYGLEPVQGSSGSAGAAGFTLGGGLGVMSRTFGLAADRVLSINVVTSDGQLRTVDADRHPELFWALRGGKGDFGVVTSYRTALERLAAFYGGGIFFDGAHAADVLHVYRHWITGVTERTSASVALLHRRPIPPCPSRSAAGTSLTCGWRTPATARREPGSPAASAPPRQCCWTRSVTCRQPRSTSSTRTRPCQPLPTSGDACSTSSRRTPSMPWCGKPPRPAAR